MTGRINRMASGVRDPAPEREQTVSAGYAKAFLDFAVMKGAARDALAAAAGLAAEDLLDPDNRIPLARYKALMRAAKELTANPAIALHFGESELFFERSILGLIIRASRNMGEAFRQMNRFGPLANDLGYTGHEGRFVVARKGSETWLEDRRIDPDAFPEITESAFARFVSDYARSFPGRPPFVRAIHMTHAAPEYFAEYRRILKAPLVFESDRNAILVDESGLEAGFPTANTYVFGIFSAHAEALLKSLEDSRTLRGKVESLLIPILHTGEISMKEISDRLGVSRATLYRKLKDEGASFEKVLDELRSRMAQHYLAGRKASVSEISFLIGFSDATAFSRAFKRWTGKSPSEFLAE